MTNLTEALREGDVSAFEVVFKDYRGMVFKTAYLVTVAGVAHCQPKENLPHTTQILVLGHALQVC